MMIATQPQSRILYLNREVGRCRVDVEEWERAHDALAGDCRAWEDIVAKANFLFGRILDLDLDIQELILAGKIPYDPERERRMDHLVADWLDVATEIAGQFGRLKSEYESVEGSEELQNMIRQAQAILTPDDQYFAGDGLVRLRDRAIDDHRAGRTEPMTLDVCDQ